MVKCCFIRARALWKGGGGEAQHFLSFFDLTCDPSVADSYSSCSSWSPSRALAPNLLPALAPASTMSSQSSLSSTGSWKPATAKAASSLDPYMVPRTDVYMYTPAPAAPPPPVVEDEPIQLTLEESFCTSQVTQYKEL